MAEKVIPVGEAILLVLMVGEETIKMRHALLFTPNGNGIVLEAPTSFLRKKPLVDRACQLMKLG